MSRYKQGKSKKCYNIKYVNETMNRNDLNNHLTFFVNIKCIRATLEINFDKDTDSVNMYYVIIVGLSKYSFKDAFDY